MGTYKLTVTHLCMGLGLSVLIKLSYNNKKDTFLALLDCGSIVGANYVCKTALEKIANEVKGNGNVLDYVHISHFDRDHYNQLKVLGEGYLGQYDECIRIKKMIFGCTGNRNIANIKQTFRGCFQIDTMLIRQGDFGNLSRGGGYGIPPISAYRELCEEIALGEDLYFRIVPILYHAQLAPQRRAGLGNIRLHDNGVYINTGSSLLMVTVVLETESKLEPEVSYLFTGDATVETMKILRALADVHFENEQKLLLIAHHGARRHVADREKTNTRPNDFSTLRWFLDLVKPNAAVVSAMCKNQNGWTHPHDDTMDVYNAFIQGEAEKVRTVTNFECVNKKIVVRQRETDKRLYETFKLDGTVDGTYYGKCNSGDYRFYDITALSDSNDPGVIYMSETKREETMQK